MTSSIWFDYLTDKNGEAEDDIDEATLEHACVGLGKIIDREVELLGDRHERLILGGMEQGCSMALHVALRQSKAIAGFFQWDVMKAFSHLYIIL